MVEELVAGHVAVSAVKNQSAEKHYGEWWKAQFRGKRRRCGLGAGPSDSSPHKGRSCAICPPERRIQDDSERFDSWQRSTWVFPSENPATKLDQRNFYTRVFVPAVQALKLEGVTWHTLRHTFASRLAMNGQAEGTIAALLRHSTTGLVRRYAHLSPTHLKAAVETVASFGKPVGG